MIQLLGIMWKPHDENNHTQLPLARMNNFTQ